MSNSTPVILDADSLDAIESNIAAGLPYAKACGRVNTMATMRASLALEKADAAWAVRVRAAEAKGATVRAEQARATAEALRPRLPAAGVAREEASDGSGVVGAVRASDDPVVQVELSGDVPAGRGAVSDTPATVDSGSLVAPPPARNALPPTVREAMAEHSKRASETTDDGQPDWGRIRADAERLYGPGRYGLYLLQEDRIAKASGGRMPATSLWWLKTFREFFESGLTWLLVMAGRSAGKSSNLERLFMVVALLTNRVVPPGQPWTAPFMSVVEKDADRRIAELVTLLMLAYRIEVKARARSILEVKDSSGNDIEIVSTAGTVGQTSGPTTVAAFFDEFAKVLTSGNLDSELIASIVGTSRDLKGWVGVRCSSAWETRGAHFASCMEGTNSENYVANIGVDFIDAALAGYEDVARWESAQGNSHAAAQIRAFAKTLHAGSPNVPTWVPRPTLSALASRMKLETLPKDDPGLEGLSRFEFWIREYGSMPLSREGGVDYAEQCYLAADISTRLVGRNGRRPSPQDGPLTHPLAPPGDPRYAGPPRGRGAPSVNWRNRKML